MSVVPFISQCVATRILCVRRISAALGSLGGQNYRRLYWDGIALGVGGRMHLKTGRLDDVATIAGYVLARSGTTYSVVVLLNHDDVHKRPGLEVQNAVLQWVHDQ